MKDQAKTMQDVDDFRTKNLQEIWAKYTATTLENERLKSELAELKTDAKCAEIMFDGLNDYISIIEANLEQEREEHKRILAETVKNIREITYPELGNIENKL